MPSEWAKAKAESQFGGMGSNLVNRIAAIDRNTEAIHWSGVSRTVMLCLLICSISCPPAKASPITHVPILPTQHWHTQWVPTDTGVYPQEVYAPALPKVEPELYVFVDIGDPPRLEAPEPGTWWLTLLTGGAIGLWRRIRN